VVFGVVAVAVASGVVMALWNWVMPATFGLPALTLGRAFALLVLSRLLLGGFSGGMGRRMHWRHRMRERWDEMSPEQRDRFMSGMQRGCGRPGPGSTSAAV
jgi:hypothetical protein